LLPQLGYDFTCAPLPELVPCTEESNEHAGVDAEILVGTGPGGRVIERDVDAFLAGSPRLSATARVRAQEDRVGSTGSWFGNCGNGTWLPICVNRVRLKVPM